MTSTANNQPSDKPNRRSLPVPRRAVPAPRRGGRRPGAGGKPGNLNSLPVPKATLFGKQSNARYAQPQTINPAVGSVLGSGF